MVSDEQLIHAFETVEAAQSDVFLTYFEFLTLACFVLFDAARLDLWILEIGLGGRLDAVNLIEPNVSIITSIGFDHQAYLGNSLEEIAVEKAGVMRERSPTFSAASNVQRTLLTEARRHRAELFWVDKVFDGNTLTLPSSGLVLDVSSARLPKSRLYLLALRWMRWAISHHHPLKKDSINRHYRANVSARDRWSKLHIGCGSQRVGM